MYRRFGSRVTIVDQAPRLMASEDENVFKEIGRICGNESIEVVTGAKVAGISRAGAGLRVTIEVGDERRELAGSHFQVAAGRKPNTDDLGLETTGIETDDKTRRISTRRSPGSAPARATCARPAARR